MRGGVAFGGVAVALVVLVSGSAGGQPSRATAGQPSRPTGSTAGPTSFRARVGGVEIGCTIESDGRGALHRTCTWPPDGSVAGQRDVTTCREVGLVDVAAVPGAERVFLCVREDGSAPALVVQAGSHLAATGIDETCPRPRVQATDLVSDPRVDLVLRCATTRAFRWRDEGLVEVYASSAGVELSYDGHAVLASGSARRRGTHRWSRDARAFAPGPRRLPAGEVLDDSRLPPESLGSPPRASGRLEVASSIGEGRCTIEARGAAVSVLCRNDAIGFDQGGAQQCRPLVIADVAPSPGAEVLWDCGVSEIATILAVRAADGRLLWASALGDTIGAEITAHVVDLFPDAGAELFVEIEGRNGAECEEGGDAIDADRFLLKWRGAELATIFENRVSMCSDVPACVSDVSFTLGSDGPETIRVVPQNRRCGRAEVHTWDATAFAYRTRS